MQKNFFFYIILFLLRLVGFAYKNKKQVWSVTGSARCSVKTFIFYILRFLPYKSAVTETSLLMQRMIKPNTDFVSFVTVYSSL